MNTSMGGAEMPRAEIVDVIQELTGIMEKIKEIRRHVADGVALDLFAKLLICLDQSVATLRAGLDKSDKDKKEKESQTSKS
ncbi:MAG: hypothetical protein ACYC48_02265 [Minisyncoccota bacterium]